MRSGRVASPCHAPARMGACTSAATSVLRWAGPEGRGLHPSTRLVHLKHALCGMLGGCRIIVTKTAKVDQWKPLPEAIA